MRDALGTNKHYFNWLCIKLNFDNTQYSVTWHALYMRWIKIKNKLIYIVISNILLHQQSRHSRQRTGGICLCLQVAGVGWAINHAL